MTNKNILAEADCLLIKHGISELPLTMRKAEIIAQFSGWLLLTYDEGGKIIEACGAKEISERYPAFTLIHDGRNVILYRADLSYEHKLFCILHEFGHITLKHTAEKNILGMTQVPEETAHQEREADDFAAEMLIPSCVMPALGIKSAHQLERFGLTAEQALRHFENIHDPQTDVEKGLCERLPEVKRHKRNFRYGHIAAVSAFVAAVATIGIFVSVLVRMGHTDKLNSSESLAGITSNVATGNPETSAVSEEISSLPESSELSGETSQSETVYITKSGRRYHKANCRHIVGHDVIEMTIAEAQEDGYTPCKDCF